MNLKKNLKEEPNLKYFIYKLISLFNRKNNIKYICINFITTIIIKFFYLYYLTKILYLYTIKNINFNFGENKWLQLKRKKIPK